MKKTAFLVIPVILYILTMPISYTIGDSIDELALVNSGESGLRPHHLLLTLLLRGVAGMTAFLPGTTMIHLQIFMVLCGVLTVAGLFFLGGRDRAALGLALFFSVSNGIWIHSSVIETGITALCALTWGLYFYTKATSRADVGLALSLFSVSVLLHAHNLILLPAFLIGYRTRVESPDPYPVWRLVIHALCVIGFAGMVTLVAGIVVTGAHDIPTLARWLVTHQSSTQIERLGGAVLVLARSLSGFFTAIVTLEGGGTAIRHALSDGVLPVEEWGRLLRPLTAGAISLVMIWLLVKGRTQRHRTIRPAALAWASLLIVNAFWLGSDPQFWLGIIPFIAAPLSAGIRSVLSRRFVPAFLALGIPILMLLNLPVREPSILFPNGDSAHQHAMRFKKIYPSAVLITPGSGWTTIVGVTSQSEVHQLFRWTEIKDPLTVLNGHVERAAAAGIPVLFEGFDPHPVGELFEAWQVAHRVTGIGTEEIRSYFLQRHAMRLEHVADEAGTKGLDLWKLTPASEAEVSGGSDANGESGQ